MANRTKHNPEKRAFRGRSHKKGGIRVDVARMVSEIQADGHEIRGFGSTPGPSKEERRATLDNTLSILRARLKDDPKNKATAGLIRFHEERLKELDSGQGSYIVSAVIRGQTKYARRTDDSTPILVDDKARSTRYEAHEVEAIAEEVQRISGVAATVSMA